MIPNLKRKYANEKIHGLIQLFGKFEKDDKVGISIDWI